MREHSESISDSVTCTLTMTLALIGLYDQNMIGELLGTIYHSALYFYCAHGLLRNSMLFVQYS